VHFSFVGLRAVTDLQRDDPRGTVRHQSDERPDDQDHHVRGDVAHGLAGEGGVRIEFATKCRDLVTHARESTVVGATAQRLGHQGRH